MAMSCENYTKNIETFRIYILREQGGYYELEYTLKTYDGHLKLALKSQKLCASQEVRFYFQYSF